METVKSFCNDIESEFVKWLDDEHRWELRRVINAAGDEMYIVYDSQTNFEEGSCYPDQVDGMIQWALDNIPFWQEMDEDEYSERLVEENRERQNGN